MVGIKLKALEGLASLDNLIRDNRNEVPKNNQVNFLACDELVPGQYQPRTVFDEENLIELMNSIKHNGIIQPIIVRPIDITPIKYEIIAGERRWRAAKGIGLSSVPTIIRNIDNETFLAFSLIENIQREDLNPIDQAVSLARLKTEFSLTHEQIGERVGWSRSTITNLLRLLDLHADVLNFIKSNQLSTGHGKLLLALPMDVQLEVANKIIEKSWSVKTTELHIKRGSQAPRSSSLDQKKIKDLQITLAAKLGKNTFCSAEKEIKATIYFDSITDLEEFVENIKLL